LYAFLISPMRATCLVHLSVRWFDHRNNIWPIPVAAWLPGSRVRMPLGTWMFVSCVYVLGCPLLVEAFATRWSLVQRSSVPCLIRFRPPPPSKKNGIWKIARYSNPKKNLVNGDYEVVMTQLSRLSFYVH
jgi:hypothetical protein